MQVEPANDAEFLDNLSALLEVLGYDANAKRVREIAERLAEFLDPRYRDDDDA